MNTLNLLSKWDWSSMSATGIDEVSSLRDFVETWPAASCVRRLKPSVNKVSSLRDYHADYKIVEN